MVNALGGGDALYVRAQTRRGDGHDAGVFRSAPPRDAGGVFALGLTQCHADVGGDHPGNGGDVGEGRGRHGRGARDHRGSGRNLLGTYGAGLSSISPPGYVLLEETADDRSYATWKALVDQRLDALRAPGALPGE